MAWGILGDILFELHRTPQRDSFTRKQKFDYAKIETFDVPKLQYLRKDLQEIEFEMRLCLYSGLDVKKELKMINEEAQKGEPLTLIIGDDILGMFVIEELEETYRTTDRNGELIDVLLKVKLKEYR